MLMPIKNVAAFLKKTLLSKWLLMRKSGFLNGYGQDQPLFENREMIEQGE